MNELNKYKKSIFENIKHIDEEGREYWEARELQRILEYKRWDKFLNVINNAKIACKKSGRNIDDHFSQVGKMIELAKDAKRQVLDYKLSRYACYLIAQNSDSRKRSVALAQTYFAIQTRKQELLEKNYEEMTEEEKRIYQRDLTKKGNLSLNKAARNAGVKNFDKFHNSGYMGLYGGETADDIAKRKGLRYREEILDNMGSVELATNLFRITQTEQKLIKENIDTEKDANYVHFNMGKDIRGFIKGQGGIMPEDLPAPNKSLKELDKENKSKDNFLA